MSPPPLIRIADKLAAFDTVYDPHIVGRYNGNEVRVAKLDGAFTWHSHAETDELFFVTRGRLRIEFRDGERTLETGDMLVVPRGVEHRPVADEPCEIVLIDREGEPNTGINPSERTREHLESLE